MDRPDQTISRIIRVFPKQSELLSLKASVRMAAANRSGRSVNITTTIYQRDLIVSN